MVARGQILSFSIDLLLCECVIPAILKQFLILSLVINQGFWMFLKWPWQTSGVHLLIYLSKCSKFL